VTAPVPISESIYAWIVGISVAAALALIPILRQCNIELRKQIKNDIDIACKKERNSDFYLEMFHLSRRYHNQNDKIKNVFVSLSGLILSSVAGFVYDQQWYVFDELYTKAALVLSGILFVVYFTPIAWGFVMDRWR